MLLGTAALMNWSDVAEADRPRYYAWHAREHMIGRIGVPGFLRGRRYAAVRAGNDFFQFYELADGGVLQSGPYRALAGAPSAETQWATQRMRNSTRLVVSRELSIGVGQGGYLLTLRMDGSAAMPTALAVDLCAQPMVCGVHAFSTGSTRVLFIEGLAADPLDRAADALQAALGGSDVPRRDLFRHEFTVTPADAAVA